MPRSPIIAATLAAACLLPAAAVAQGPPPPTATSGKPVTTVAHGVTTPTSFAFHGSTIFAGSGPAEGGNGPTGLFTLAGGAATSVPGTPKVVFGLAWHAKQLYVSTGPKIVAFRGWNGTRFSGRRTISSPRKPFAGFNGLAFGPDGRLYAGVTFRDGYDHKQDPSKYAQSVVSMTAKGRHLKTVATGLRQPFQLVFPKGSRHPYVGILGQDAGKGIPQDAIVKAKPGQDYGFPTCKWGRPKTCKGFAAPAILLPKHSSPMGIGAIGKRLYVSLFGGLGDGKPIVATVPAKGGTPKPFLQGFVAPVIALGIHAGKVYVGDLTGTIYSVGA